MTNSNLTVNIQNVFVLITVTMVFVSIPVLYWALSNLSIKKTIPGMLIFLAAFGTGIWASFQIQDETIGGIRNYLSFFAGVCLIYAMLQLLYCLFYSYRMEYEKINRKQNTSIFFEILTVVILVLMFITE